MSQRRDEAIVDGVAAALLVLALLLPWNLYFGFAVPGSSTAVRAALFTVTLLSLVPVALGYLRPHAWSDGLRLVLNVPYLLLVLAFVVFDVIQTALHGGTVHLPGGAGPGAWLGVAGALLSARPVARGGEKSGEWLRLARIIGYASMLGAALSVGINLYWRVRYGLHGTDGLVAFGKPNIAVIATSVVYGIAPLVAIFVASRWLLGNAKGSRLATVALGVSTLAAGIIVWTLPVGRDVDAFRGIAQNTSTAGVGFEGYLAWAAAAAIFLPSAFSALSREAAEDALREAARKCLLLITVWCLGSVAMRITDLVVSAVLHYPHSPYDSVVLTVFDVATAGVAIWLRANLARDTVSARLTSSLSGLVAALAISRVVVGVALAPRFHVVNAPAQNPLYGNDLAQQITSTFDVLLCALALCVLAAAIGAGRLRGRRLRPAAQAPRIFRGDDSATRRIPVGAPRLYRPQERR